MRGVCLLEQRDGRTDMEFINSVDGGSGKYGDEYNDHNNRADTSCKGFILWLIIKAESNSLREEVEAFYKVLKLFCTAHR